MVVDSSTVVVGASVVVVESSVDVDPSLHANCMPSAAQSNWSGSPCERLASTSTLHRWLCFCDHLNVLVHLAPKSNS